jgi:NAD(P)H-dependent flavin oxidoreductase YrpB (nitropropane dioxygenase family)
MRAELCDRFGIDYPIFAFTPSEKVAAAVSKAGGLGVLGCVRFNDPGDLETVLQWMDANTDGKPYGVDVVMPAKVHTEGTAVDIDKLVPQSHRDFVDKTLPTWGCRRCPRTGRAPRVCSAGCTRSRAPTSTGRSSTRSS